MAQRKGGEVMGQRVLLGMSGGVDSSVAAYLLKEQGDEVIGATMRLWVDEDSLDLGGCCSLSAVEDARFVAHKLGIPHYVLNYKEIFREQVVDYFVAEYKAGRTPNPCIACNSRVRFTTFLEQAQALGCHYIATGHYARITERGDDRGDGSFCRALPTKGTVPSVGFCRPLSRNEARCSYRLQRAVDRQKDQTYMLFRMTEEQMAQTLFPLGALEKTAVRAIAAKLGLAVANKPDSQEVCFIPDDNYKRFLQTAGVSFRPGKIVDEAGQVLGSHAGIHGYTVGQRKGLGLTSPEPLYVLRIDPVQNLVVVGPAASLMKREVVIDELHFLEKPTPSCELTAKVRYSNTRDGTPCTVSLLGGDRALVVFREAVRAPTPGQSLVIYRGDLVVGGGTIVD